MEKAEKERLPASYNENVLVLLVQNPHVVFAYLELSERFWGALMRHGRPVLRLYDVTGEAMAVAAEEVLPPFTAGWYFRGLAPGRTYALEMGWRDEGGVFVPLLRSNTAATPANERGVTRTGRKIMVVPATPPGRAARPPETRTGAEPELPSSYPF